MGKKKIKLHIGCGDIYKKGYVNIDAYNLSVADIKAKANKVPYPEKSVDLIENHHLLEHLDRKTLKTTLKEWFRILKPRGKLIIEVPNLEKNIEIFLKSSYHERWENYRKEFEHGRIQLIYGKGEEQGQLHKNGFDKERLKRILQNHGFVKIKVLHKRGTPIQGENLIAVCEKSNKRISKKSRNGENYKSLKKKDKEVGLSRQLLRKLKNLTVFGLRYLADTIEEIKISK